VGKDNHINQLIQAVKNHPGSAAYAVLAEHYLERNSVDEALKVCQEGFAANPSYERGAIAYLSVLRKLRKHKSASDVFGRAVAYVPRSAKLRVAWSMILAEAGRDPEARRYAREAMDLDPLNREARALVATLGGTPSFVHPRGEDGLEGEQTPSLTDEDEDNDDEDRPSLGVQAATVRPRVRPIGQRTTPHSLFDLTPGPAMAEHLAELNRHGPSPFDITPPPVDVPEIPGLPRAQPGPPPPPAPPQSAHNAPTAEIDPSMEDLVQSAGDPAAQDPLVEVLEPSMEEIPSSVPPPPPVPSRPTAPPPDQATDVQIHTELVVPLPSDDLAPLPTRKIRWWLWIPLLILVLAGGGFGGFYHYQKHQASTLQQGLEAAQRRLLPDTPTAYAAAAEQLSALIERNPGKTRIRAALALVRAHQVARFGAPPAAATEATALLEGLDPAQTAATRALLFLPQDLAQAEAALKQASSAAEPDWHLRLARALVSMARGDVASAKQTLTDPGDVPALLHAAAIHRRRSGATREALALVLRGLKASPEHTGLKIQQALIAVTTKEAVPDAAALAELARTSAPIPRYAAAAALAQALAASASGDHDGALTFASAARKLQPNDPEYSTRLGIHYLGTGGNVTQATPLLEEHGAVMAKYDPSWALWRVRALLLSGRPQAARKVLGETKLDALDAVNKLWHQELEVRCMDLADDMSALRSACAAPTSWVKPGLRRRIACVEALLSRSRLKEAGRLVSGLKEPQLLLYGRALQALAVGDATSALRRLARVRPQRLPDPVGHHLALARALSTKSESARATKTLRAAVVLDARSVRTRVALALSLVAGGHDSEAQSILEAILADKPTQPGILGRAGAAFLSLGLPGKAQILLRQGLTAKTSSAAMQMLAGRVALANNRLNEAAEMFQAVLKQDPKAAQALMELGRIMAVKKKTGPARRYFAQAIRLRPRDPDLLLQLAKVHADSGKYHKAFTTGKRAVDLLRAAGEGSRVTDATIVLARCLRDGDRWAQKKAEEVLFQATKPKNAPAKTFHELGLLYKHQREPNRAIWCFRRAVERDSRLAESQLELGLTLSKKRRWRRDALRALRAFLRLRPKGADAARVKALIKRIK
jgi:tetratricopeptide (TPR) repeat protein